MEELGVMNKPQCIYNVDEKGCSLCLHKHQLDTWFQEMLTGNIGLITLRDPDNMASCMLLGKLLHLRT
jgi:hypothetical protein